MVRIHPVSTLLTGFSSDDLNWKSLFLNLLEQIQSSVPFELYKPQPGFCGVDFFFQSSVPFELYKPQRFALRARITMRIKCTV